MKPSVSSYQFDFPLSILIYVGRQSGNNGFSENASSRIKLHGIENEVFHNKWSEKS